jgi:hypothetical protein
MRFPALAAFLALAVLIALSDEKAPGAAKPAPRPAYTPPPAYRPGGGGGGNRAWNPGNRPTQDLTITFNDVVGKVRSVDPPENFDEKGNVKKYTKAQLQKLKGDDPAEKKMIGYKTEFSEVKVGDVIQITVSVPKKAAAAAKPAKKAAKAKKDDDADADKDAKEDKADKPDKPDKLAAKGDKETKWVVSHQMMGKVTKLDSGGSESGRR